MTTDPRIKQSYWHMEVLPPLCVLWDKAIKDFCTDFPHERMWVPWEATHELIKSNQAISCSELILGRGQTDMPFCPLPKNQSSKSVKSHASVITCVHIILKKSNKSIHWFIRIDIISDLIDDLINLIKSMPTLLSLDGKLCLSYDKNAALV